MKKLTANATIIANTDNFTEFNHEAPIDEKSGEIINYIFHRLESIIPSMRYTHESSVSLGRIKKEFLYELRSKNINKVEVINVALDNIREKGLRFIPTPGEFVALCVPKPVKLGVPTHAVAYNEAVRRSYPGGSDEKWSHGVVYHAWFETGARALNMATGSYQIKEMKDLFYANYDITLKMFAEGGKLRELPKLLNKPDLISEVTKEGTETLSKLKKMAGAKP